MNIFLDTEFDGHGGELISMALVVGHGGPHWYEVCAIPTSPGKLDPAIPHNALEDALAFRRWAERLAA